MVSKISLGLISSPRQPEPMADRRQNLLDWVKQAGRQGCQLVALPELADHNRTHEAMNAYLNGRQAVAERVAMTMDHPWLTTIRELAKKYRMVVIPNVVLIDGESLFDSAIAFGPDGEYLGRYDKAHLAGGESRFFDPGRKIAPIETPFGKVGVIICYDIHFPELTRCYELQDADLLLWTTMRHGEIEEDLFRTILPGRCLTHHMPLAVTTYILEDQQYSCNPMSTALFDPRGRIIAGGVRTPGVLVASIDLADRPHMHEIWNQSEWIDSRQLKRRQRRPDLYGDLVRR